MNTLVLEETEHGEIPVDVYQKLANDRILFICNRIDDQLASDIVATLILKDAEDSESKVTLFINSEGGDIRNVLMIYDMMTTVECPIETVCIGSAMDEAALLLAAGTPGMRFATKNASVAVGQLYHEWMAHVDLTNAKKILNLSVSDNNKMMEIFAKCTKKTKARIIKDFDRRVFFSSTEAKEYGFIDNVVGLKEVVPAKPTKKAKLAKQAKPAKPKAKESVTKNAT